MKFKKNFLLNYLTNAPMALGIERFLECEILSQQEFIPPILDIGCGDGLFAHILFDERIDIGVEPNLKELKRAKSFNAYRELINSSGEQIPKNDRFYNTIFANSTLEHIQNLQPVLREVHRLLASSGKFYVTVPTNMFDKFTVMYQILSFLRLKKFAEKYKKFFNKFWKQYHHYKKEDWEEIFIDAGFKIIEFREYDSKIICLINDFLVPFAFLPFITKKLLNRWIISKRIRKVYICPFYLLARALIGRYRNGQNGLIFFFLMKE